MAEQQAILKTNKGDITIDLFPNHAPETVDNFVGLATGEKDVRHAPTAAPARSTTASASTGSSPGS